MFILKIAVLFLIFQVKHFDRRREYLKFKNAVDSGKTDIIEDYMKKSSKSSTKNES
jgi:hypothetical protein